MAFCLMNNNELHVPPATTQNPSMKKVYPVLWIPWRNGQLRVSGVHGTVVGAGQLSHGAYRELLTSLWRPVQLASLFR